MIWKKLLQPFIIIYLIFILFQLNNLLQFPPLKTRYKWFSDEPFNSTFKLSSNYTNWMININNSISIKKLSIPGTHDSCARKFLNEELANQYYLKTQNWDILTQLKAGIRYFDLRPGENFTIYHIIHTIYNFDEVLEIMVNFLNEYPSEFLIVRFQFQNHTCLTHLNIDECKEKFTKPILDKYINYFYRGNDFPNIGEIRGKIFPLIEYFKYENFTDWTEGTDNLFLLQDFYKLGKKSDIQLKRKLIYEYFYIKSDNKLIINHISAHSNMSKISTRYIRIRLNEIPYRYNNFKGVFPIDFPSEELIMHIINQNNIFFLNNN